MVFFPLDFVLRGFPVAEYFMYASQKTLVRPCPTEKILIYEYGYCSPTPRNNAFPFNTDKRAEWMIFFEKRMLFEWLGDRLKKQANTETVSLKEFKIMLRTYRYFKESFLFFSL
jgi:hypothetical protein